MVETKKILILDDEPDIVVLTEKMLQFGGYETIPCTNEIKALKIIEQEYQDIALILLDDIMPSINGYEILKMIKTNEKYKDILVVLFSARTFHEDIQKARELGADGYIAKLFSANELLEYMKNILSK